MKMIDWNKVEHMFIAGSTITQACAAIGITRAILYKKCLEDNNCTLSDYHAEKREKGNMCIHAAQYEKAIKEKNPTMLIWLGKQRLHQKEILDDVMSKEIEKKFDEQMGRIMKMLSNDQDLPSNCSNLKIEDNSISSETKS